MARIKDRIDKHLNDTFMDNLHEYLSSEFPGVSFEGRVSLSSFRLVTEWDSKDPMVCEKIKRSSKAFEAAYTKARQEVFACK